MTRISPLAIAYHEVTPSDSSYIYSVSCSQFEDHLRAAQETGADGSVPETSPLQITFDDGHLSQYTYALPVLEKLRVKAVFCVTAGWTNREPDYMNGAQLRELVALGHTVYAHGWSHRMLTHCSPSELHVELQGSKQALEDLLGSPVEGISMPHGRWNERILHGCASCGFKDVFVSDPALTTTERCGVRLSGRLMITRTMSSSSLLDRARRGGRLSSKERVRRCVTGSAKLILGDRLYRKLWRHLGNKEQDLPQAPPFQREVGVLQLISSGGFYGAESMLLNLVRATPREGVRTVLGVFENSQNPHLEVADRAAQHGVKTEVIRCSGRLDRHAIQTIQRLVYQHGIDVIHTHGSKAAFYARVAAIGLKVQLLATYHNSSPGQGAWLKLYHFIDRLTLRGFSSIVAVSEPIRDSLCATGINPQKISVIGNGVDIESFARPGHREALRSNPNGHLTVGVVGRLIPLKGHRFLLEAAPDILREHPDVKFVFIGDGPERSNLETLVRKLRLEKAVDFTGKRDDMPAVYHSLDLLVSPSLHEGMPMTLVEALASGCPVIATNVGDVPKLIRHEETGVLVEPGNTVSLRDALTALLADSSRRATLATQGQRWAVAHFSSEGMADRYTGLYAQLSNSDFSPQAHICDSACKES